MKPAVTSLLLAGALLAGASTEACSRCVHVPRWRRFTRPRPVCLRPRAWPPAPYWRPAVARSVYPYAYPWWPRLHRVDEREIEIEIDVDD